MSKTYTTADVCRILGLPRPEIHQRAKRRGIAPKLLAGRAFWSQAALDALRGHVRDRTLDGWITYQQAAKALGISPSTVRARLASTGTRRELRHGRAWIKAGDLRRIGNA